MDIDDISMADDSSLDQNTVSSVTPPQNKFSIDVLSGKSDNESIGKSSIQQETPDPEHSEMFECDEQVVLERLQSLYPHVDMHKLPRQWSTSDRWTGSDRYSQTLELSTDFLRVTKRGSKSAESTHKDAAALRANRPIPKSTIVYYFEIKVISKGAEGRMGFGLSEKNVNLNRLPGWESVSYGYHGDDGHFFQSSGKGVDYGPTFTTGDTVGCGLNFVTRELFFTKNGKSVGVAALNIPIINDLYPTVGMQSYGEMVDVNFGQKNFVYDIGQELKNAEAKVSNSITSMELPIEKSLWMNRMIMNWLTHEGYSRVLESFQKANGFHLHANNPIIRNESGFADSMVSQNSSRSTRGSLSTRSNKKSSSSQNSRSETQSAAVAAAAASVAENIVAVAMGNATGRPSVVRSVQQFIHEQMDERRMIVQLVKKGNCSAAIEKIEHISPNLLSTNKELALLLKIQQFVELVEKTAKLQEVSNKCDAPSTSKVVTNKQQISEGSSHLKSSSCSNSHNAANGTCTLFSLSSTVQNGNSCTNNNNLQHNGNNATLSTFDEIMDDGENSNSLPPLTSISNGTIIQQQNSFTASAATNGSIPSSAIDRAVAPFTSTTIIEENDGDGGAIDGFDLEFEEDDEQMEQETCGGFSSADEKSYFERYLELIKFGQEISEFALQHCGGQLCAGLRTRMNEAFSLICHSDPYKSQHSYLLKQKERDFVAKALNKSLLENICGDGISPLDKVIRQAKSIREQSVVHSASSHLTKLFGEMDDGHERASSGMSPPSKTSSKSPHPQHSCEPEGSGSSNRPPGSLRCSNLSCLTSSRKKSA